MEIGDFVINFDRKKIGQITKVMQENGITFCLEVKILGGNVINLLVEEIGQYSDKLIPLLKPGDIVNGYQVRDIIKDQMTNRQKVITDHILTNWQGDRTILQFYEEEIENVMKIGRAHV